MSRNGKVVVAMSGGVDSSVAAALLREGGYDCVGVLMRNGIEPPAPTAPADPGSGEGPACTARTCCSAADAVDARRVAARLGIPFYVVDFEREFESVIRYFTTEYHRGRTPNPCVMCNQHLKFGKLFAYADAVGAEFVATGHYARLDRTGPTPSLRRGVDAGKDQSYALFGVRRELLARMLLPVGGYHKPAIRELARTQGLVTADKPDSQEICFVPDDDYVGLLRRRDPQRVAPGDVLDMGGKVVGRHAGYQTVTVGQRKGLRIALGRPVFVVRTDPAANTITVGDRADLACGEAVVKRVNWLADVPSEAQSPHGFAATVQVRYNHDGAASRVRTEGRDTDVRVRFDPPEHAVTPGQAAVIYDGDRVIGGGWIESTVPAGKASCEV